MELEELHRTDSISARGFCIKGIILIQACQSTRQAVTKADRKDGGQAVGGGLENLTSAIGGPPILAFICKTSSEQVN